MKLRGANGVGLVSPHPEYRLKIARLPIHGLLLIAYWAVRSRTGVPPFVQASRFTIAGRVLGWAITLVLVCCTWAFFRAATVDYDAHPSLNCRSGCTGLDIEGDVEKLSPLVFPILRLPQADSRT